MKRIRDQKFEAIEIKRKDSEIRNLKGKIKKKRLRDQKFKRKDKAEKNEKLEV